MNLLMRAILCVQCVTLGFALAYVFSLATVISRLKSVLVGESGYHPQFAEWVPAPHGKLADLYELRLHGRRALTLTGRLWNLAMYSSFLWMILWMISVIFG